MALDILNWFLPPSECDRIQCFKGYCSNAAWRLKHKFVNDFIATMPKEGGEISADTIRAWIEQRC
jgi:hypothetical protein